MPERDPKRRLGRRLLALRVAAGGTAIMSLAHARPAEAQRSDSDPGDPPGRGQCGTRFDCDPRDPVAGRPLVAGPTDRDPTDKPGRGRGSQPRTDSDPTDAAGRGRR